MLQAASQDPTLVTTLVARLLPLLVFAFLFKVAVTTTGRAVLVTFKWPLRIAGVFLCVALLSGGLSVEGVRDLLTATIIVIGQVLIGAWRVLYGAAFGP